MKISSPYPPEINAALKENLPELAFINDDGFILPTLPLPLRIGEILDCIHSAGGKTLHIGGGFKLDTAKYTIDHNGKNLSLTEKEIAILKFLTQSKTPASRDAMLKNIWGYSDTADSKTVENHIYRLRQKLFATFAAEIIITESGGYKLIES